MAALRSFLKSAQAGTGEIQKAIEASTFDIGERGFTMLIATCGRSGRWKKALDVFDAMCGESMFSKGIRPNAFSYSATISVCCGAKACGKALEVYGKMKAVAREDSTLSPTSFVFEALIPECHRSGRYDKAAELYEEMLSMGMPPSSPTLLCVVEAYLGRKNLKLAAEAIDRVHSMGKALPKKCYRDFIRGCAEQRDCEMAVEMFLSMQMAGVPVDSPTCHWVMRVAEETDRLDVGSCLLQEILTAGIEIPLKTYNCLARILTKGDWKSVAAALVKIGQGESLDEEGLSVMLEKYVKSGAGKKKGRENAMAKLNRVVGLQSQAWTIKSSIEVTASAV